jgi:multiple sugar transport system substrate-binding protein
MDRRGFLRLAGGAAVVAAGFSCGGSGSDDAAPASKKRGSGPGGGERRLRIAQGVHFVPAYDAWFDGDYARRWGEERDVKVVIEHFPFSDVFPRAEAEMAAQAGHDIIGLIGAPPAVFEDHVIDHRDLVEEVEAKVGKTVPAIERDIRNRRTGKYFAFADFWVASPTLYRADLWDAVEPGLIPDTWDDLVRAGARLKAAGTPIGIGLMGDVDANSNPFGLLFAHGASVQDEGGHLALDRPATIEAVKTGVALFQEAMTEEVLGWDDAADNRFLSSGKASLTIDPVSAVRATETQDPTLAEKIRLRPAPAGPAARLFPHVTQTYVIWRFSENQELARQFLVDLALDYRDAFLRSQFYNLPAFPGSVPDFAELVTQEAGGKYSVLADAAAWCTNLGHPGDTNAAVAEVFHERIVPKMFAAAARGELRAEEAVKTAAAQAEPIFAKWRERGKI